MSEWNGNFPRDLLLVFARVTLVFAPFSCKNGGKIIRLIYFRDSLLRHLREKLNQIMIVFGSCLTFVSGTTKENFDGCRRTTEQCVAAEH